MQVSGDEISCELMVIGSGMAGMAASVFAANRGIDVVQVGITGEINFASGLIDLLGVHPVETGRIRRRPFTAIEELVADNPDHPYARVPAERIRQAVEEMLSFLADAGQPYRADPAQNLQVLTPAGTVKTTYAVPLSMAGGCDALADRLPCLLVGFHRLKGYSARQMVESIGGRWPALRGVRIEFPDLRGELYTEKMAWALETDSTRQALAERIRPHMGDAQAVGLPAVLGIYRTAEVMAGLRDALGAEVFEIPTMLPAITGLRLREAFEQRLPQLGVRTRYQQKVTRVETAADGTFRFRLGPDSAAASIRSRAAVLATGRFFGKGLVAERTGIREPLFNLPVHQPADRDLWHHKDFLHPAGHLINRAGLQVDAHFRPVDRHGAVVHPALFACGAVLAHQDWIRQKCGSGLAIVSAYGAIAGLRKRAA